MNTSDRFSKKQLAAVDEAFTRVMNQVPRDYRQEAEDILKQVRASFNDLTQELAEQYVAKVARSDADSLGNDIEDAFSDWTAEDVRNELVTAFKAGFTAGRVTPVR